VNAIPVMHQKPASRDDSAGFDADVLIVGAGPVGLLLANLLGVRGIRTLVCDQRTSPLVGSMAIGVTPPSLEILRPLGLDTVLREAGVPVRHAEVHESRRFLGRLDFAGIASAYPFFLSIPQERTVEILRDNLRKFPCVQVQDGMEFTGLSQGAGGVQTGWHQVTSRLGFQLHARLLAGCDGHRSRVREAAGLTVRERLYPQRFIMGDFLDHSGLGAEARLFFTPEGSVESFPLPGGWRRWILQIGDLNSESPTEHLIRNVRRLTGHGLGADPVRFVSPFGAKRMIANRYHAGRVFLAGDAAHVMSSIGGQGMNTGFADAEMLAELLDHALRRPEALPAGAAAYDRIRRAAFEVAATRAERGMWLGTLRGRVASCCRGLFIRRVLFSRVIRHRLAPHFAMLTIPFRNLNHVPRAWLATP